MVRTARLSPGDHVDGRDWSNDDQFERLATASAALRGRRWTTPEGRPTGNALRATVLELAELVDAASSARSSLAGVEARTMAYLDRLGRFVTHASEAVVAATFDPSADVRDRLAEALALWDEQVPWDVMLEIAWDEGVERHVFEASAAWGRAARRLTYLRARAV